MEAATLQRPRDLRAGIRVADTRPGRFVDAREFSKLLVSHRRMVRMDRRDQRLRGLRDLDTGEVFLIDERRLLEAVR